MTGHIDHVSLGVRDLARATAFYERVLGAIGWQVHRCAPAEVAFGPPDAWSFFLYPAPTDPIVGARMHLAFRTSARATVRALYDTALREGGNAITDRAPAERPQFGEDYFGAVFHDPDGHTIEILTRSAT